MPSIAQRNGQRLEHRSAVSAASSALLDVLQQDRELVAAEAGRGVAGADARVEPLGDLDEHLVAGSVAEAVVDGLEVVEVEEHDGEAAALAPRAGRGVADALAEQRAVGQAGDGIVEGLVRELLLERLALGDVAALRTMPWTCSSSSRFV